jgi:hypothetical protein
VLCSTLSFLELNFEILLCYTEMTDESTKVILSILLSVYVLVLVHETLAVILYFIVTITLTLFSFHSIKP